VTFFEVSFTLFEMCDMLIHSGCRLRCQRQSAVGQEDVTVQESEAGASSSGAGSRDGGERQHEQSEAANGQSEVCTAVVLCC
jgi:hypothetical protein